jgi:hypothetical protein
MKRRTKIDSSRHELKIMQLNIGAVSSRPSSQYRLMIYFAHSTMVMYAKTIVSHEKMSIWNHYTEVERFLESEDIEELMDQPNELKDQVDRIGMNLSEYKHKVESLELILKDVINKVSNLSCELYERKNEQRKHL